MDWVGIISIVLACLTVFGGFFWWLISLLLENQRKSIIAQNKARQIDDTLSSHVQSIFQDLNQTKQQIRDINYRLDQLERKQSYDRLVINQLNPSAYKRKSDISLDLDTQDFP